MSVKEEFRSADKIVISCLSTDTKPTHYPAGTILWERDSDTGESFEYDGNSWVSSGANGAAKVRSIPGPQTQSRNRFLDIASGAREKVEWPSGSNITEITIFATLSTAQITAGTSGIYARVALDAASDAIADAMLTRVSGVTDDAQWIPIPIDTLVTIPLTDALSNGTLSGGRLDIITDEGQALDVWIGAN